MPARRVDRALGMTTRRMPKFSAIPSLQFPEMYGHTVDLTKASIKVRAQARQG